MARQSDSIRTARPMLKLQLELTTARTAPGVVCIKEARGSLELSSLIEILCHTDYQLWRKQSLQYLSSCLVTYR